MTDAADRNGDGLVERRTAIEFLLVPCHEEHAVIDAGAIQHDRDVDFNPAEEPDDVVLGQNGQREDGDFDRNKDGQQRDDGQNRRAVDREQEQDHQDDCRRFGVVGALAGGNVHVAAHRRASAEREVEAGGEPLFFLQFAHLTWLANELFDRSDVRVVLPLGEVGRQLEHDQRRLLVFTGQQLAVFLVGG